MGNILSPHRRIRVLTVGVAATVSLYALVLAVAEPLRSFAANSPSTVATTVTVASTISNSCTSPVNMGTLTGNGDTDSSGFNASRSTTCTVITNNATGYTIGWLISTGTGAAGARTGTGHLNGYTTPSSTHRIRAFTPAATSTPRTFSTAVVGASDGRWAARLSSTSTTATGAHIDWGVAGDGATDLWLNVATGSTVNIANRSTQTSAGGDTELVGFRTIIGSSFVVPTDTYKASVTFTATTNP